MGPNICVARLWGYDVVEGITVNYVSHFHSVGSLRYILQIFFFPSELDKIGFLDPCENVYNWTTNIGWRTKLVPLIANIFCFNTLSIWIQAETGYFFQPALEILFLAWRLASAMSLVLVSSKHKTLWKSWPNWRTKIQSQAGIWLRSLCRERVFILHLAWAVDEPASCFWSLFREKNIYHCSSLNMKGKDLCK